MTTVAIAGLGPRGFYTYAQYQKVHPERIKVTAIADIDETKLYLAAEDLHIPPEGCFKSAEEMLSKDKLADVLIVATQDKQHIAHALAGLERGYDLILEKPVATTPEDCIAIRDAAKRLNRKVAVCYVLRYTTFYRTIKNIIYSGRIGEVVNVDAVENVGYWHQAHSFVRGNWSNCGRSSPMILQKSCHDMDILNFLIGSHCECLSSFGSLSFFNSEHRPKDAAEFCVDCPRKESCVYSAERIYLGEDTQEKRPWVRTVVAPAGGLAEVKKALRRGPYGSCVFVCDNDVVDHQTVALRYENGVTVSFTMSAFSAEVYRSIRIMGTQGEIEGEQKTNLIRCTTFDGKTEVYDINKLASDLSGHGGGDNQLLTDFFDENSEGHIDAVSGIYSAIESHMMAFAAEYSRLHDGESINLKQFEKSVGFSDNPCKEEKHE
ncbi:MAG: Gfo/Idh/MocA family protein [Christensenellaceae bacterium]